MFTLVILASMEMFQIHLIWERGVEIRSVWSMFLNLVLVRDTGSNVSHHLVPKGVFEKITPSDMAPIVEY